MQRKAEIWVKPFKRENERLSDLAKGQDLKIEKWFL
jgi:hypothetical protein